MLNKALKRNTLLTLLSAVLAPVVMAATPEMPKGMTVKELMPSKPFPTTYPGFEARKASFRRNLKAAASSR